MKTKRVLAILVLSLGLMVWPVEVSGAEPMGTAFTYQGLLYDANIPADGEYDFQFKLYDDANVVDGNQVGEDVNVPDVDVVEGYFTVELDFNDANAFKGEARWLEIGVRPGEMNDPNGYTPLRPRQEVTPTPYARYAASAPGVPVPLALSGSDSGALVKATNTGSGDGVQGETWSSSGRGVEGWALYTGTGTNYGGYFRAEGSYGYGVYGYASNSGPYGNYGGYFQAAGSSGTGVYGFVTGDNGHAVQGMAFDSGSVTNYGGHFTSRGASGRGVYGEASKTGDVENYGGYFTAAGNQGRAVYGEATGSDGVGVYGNSSSGDGVYGSSTTGNGVYGQYKGTDGGGYGVRGLHDGYGTAIHGECSYNFYCIGTGVYGKGSGYGVYGISGDSDYQNSYGVYGKHDNSGNYGYLAGEYYGVYGNGYYGVYGVGDPENGRGVYGYCSSGYGVYGNTNTGYAGYFDGDLHVEGDITYTGSCTDISDIRLKENITPLRGAIEKISCLKGIYFNNKGESSDEREVGVIAQDVEKVLPELVLTNKEGYKSVDYSKLTPVLIEAVKELKAENESLNQRLETQEKTLQQLQTVITKGAVQ